MKKTSGIYCFEHRGKPFIYIGSSANIEERYMQHKAEFNRGTHHNSSLQQDYLDGFLNFEILAKRIPHNRLKEVEQQYCELFLSKGYLLYNSVLPRPSNYNESMLCSKSFFDKVEELIEENKILVEKLGKPSKDNIFVELELL